MDNITHFYTNSISSKSLNCLLHLNNLASLLISGLTVACFPLPRRKKNPFILYIFIYDKILCYKFVFVISLMSQCKNMLFESSEFTFFIMKVAYKLWSKMQKALIQIQNNIFILFFFESQLPYQVEKKDMCVLEVDVSEEGVCCKVVFCEVSRC